MTKRSVSLVALIFALVGLVAVPTGVRVQQETEPWDTSQDSFKSLIEAIENSDAQIRALKQQDVQQVQFVSLEAVRSDLDKRQEQRLDQALKDASTEELHRAMSQNETITTSMKDT